MVSAGQRVLDVGCGPGALTAELVKRLGAAAVSAVDPSEPFVAAVEERHPGVDVRRAAAEELPFEDAEFDATLAQLVVLLMDDPTAGVAEMVRVTRKRGVVAASVWDYAGGRGPVSMLWDAARELDPDVADESHLAGVREGHLAELFDAAGLEEIEEATHSIRVEHSSFEEWWEPLTFGVGPAGSYVAGLDPHNELSSGNPPREAPDRTVPADSARLGCTRGRVALPTHPRRPLRQIVRRRLRQRSRMLLEGYVHLSCGSPVQRTGLRSGGERTAVARGVRGLALLGSRGSSARSPGDDRLSAQDALQPGALARSEGVSRRFAADCAETRRSVASGGKPSSARLRTEDGRELSHRGRARRGHGSIVHHGASPELRSPAAVGRPPVVTGTGPEPLRRSGRRSRVGRPRPACMGARRARHGVRCPLRALSRPSRSGYLNSLRAFDAVFVLDLGDGKEGIVGFDTKYHEWAKPETPKPSNLWRYIEVADKSGVFGTGAVDEVKEKTGLAVMWLEHLLLLSMLQHSSGRWGWGRYVVVHPFGNVDFAEACARYAGLLVEHSTFSSVTLEELLDASVLPPRTAAALRARYLPD